MRLFSFILSLVFLPEQAALQFSDVELRRLDAPLDVKSQLQQVKHKLELHNLNPKKVDDECGSEDSHCECKKCIWGSVHWIIEHAEQKVDDWCSDVELPKKLSILEKMVMFKNEQGNVKCDDNKKYWCKWWHDKRQVALGFLIHEIRPMSLGSAYCMGKGECHHEKPENLLFDGTMGGNLPHVELPFSALQAMSSKPIAPTEEKFIVASARHLYEEEGSGETCPHDDGHVDVGCYKKVFHAVMEKAVEGTKEMCAETECPFLKKCALGQESIGRWLTV